MGRRKHAWTDADVALMGTVPDAAVAARLGVLNTTVYYERTRRGIPPFRLHRGDRRTSHLDQYADAFGTMPDARIARAAGVTPTAVVAYRKRHPGLPPTPPQPAGLQALWIERVRHRLGVERDSVIAAEVGVSKQRVAQVRNTLGIGVAADARTAHYVEARAERWHEREATVVADAERMVRAGVPCISVAENLGVVPATVRNWQRKYGWPPFTHLRSCVLKDYVHLFPTHTNAEIAAVAGTTPSAVNTFRYREGLPPSPRRNQRGPPS